jgi:uncharacterized membrane protein YkoI
MSKLLSETNQKYSKILKIITFLGLIFISSSLLSGAASAATNLSGAAALTSTSSNTHNTQLTIISTVPSKGTINVALNPQITVIFNKDIKAGTNYIQLISIKGKSIKTTKTITGNKLIITPKFQLANGTKYILILHTKSVTDLAGNALQLSTITFTTTYKGIQTKITPAEAQKIANKYIEVSNATAGTPNLVKQSGKLVYIVPVVSNGINVGEIDIDAQTGKNLGGAGGAP